MKLWRRLILSVTAWGAMLPASGETAFPEEAFSTAATFSEIVTEPGDDAAEMMRYQDYPVSYASGAVGIEVPLLSFSCGDVDMALGLSYHTGGISARQTAGYVGLGWRLTGLPRICRQIIGIDDTYMADVRWMSDNRMDNAYAEKLANGGNGFYDIFTYEIPGYSGSFYLIPQAGGKHTVSMLPPNGLVITPQYSDTTNPDYKFKSFIIETPEGIRYTFGAKETSADVLEDSPVPGKENLAQEEVTGWNVTDIRAIGSNDPITITYSDSTYYKKPKVINAKSAAIIFEKDKPTLQIPDRDVNPRKKDKLTLYRHLVPVKISCRTATVEFIRGNYGLDWDPYEDQITFIEGMVLKNGVGNEIRHINLAYTDTLNRTTRHTNRIAKLSSVEITAGDTLLDRRNFAYIDTIGQIKGVDLYGNYSTKPIRYAFPVRDYPQPGHYKTSPGSGALHLLNKITDARGLVTEFRYSTKSCVNAAGDTTYIGQKVDSIIATDRITGRKRIRRFVYSNPKVSIDISQLPRSAWESLDGVHQEITGYTPHTYNILSVTRYATPRAPGAAIESAAIYYSDVDEFVSGTGISRPLRTSMHYDLAPVIHKIKTVTPQMPPQGNDSMGRYLGRFSVTANDSVDKQWADTTFVPRPLNCYIEKNYGSRPLLTKRVKYEWRNGAYTPYETEWRNWRRNPSMPHVLGVYCESLIYKTLSGSGSSARYRSKVKDWRTDVSAFDVTATAHEWLCDSVITRRHFPDGNHRDITTVIKYDIDRTSVDADSCTSSHYLHSRPVGMTYSCGGMTVDRMFLFSANIKSDSYKAINDIGYHALPVMERIVAGSDTLDRRYEYAIFNGIPRLTRRFTARGARQALESERFTAYEQYGHPTASYASDGTTRTWSWDKQDNLTRETIGGTLSTTYTWRPLVGCTMIAYPSTKIRRYDWAGGRLMSESNALYQLSAMKYGLYATHGFNFIQQANLTGGSSYATHTTRNDGFGMPVLAIAHNAGGTTNLNLFSAVSYDALDRVTEATTPFPYAGIPSFTNYNYFRRIAVSAAKNASPFTQNTYPGRADDLPSLTFQPGQTTFDAFENERLCNGSGSFLQCWKFEVRGYTLVKNYQWAPGMLDVVKTVDPDGVTLLTFSDWRGLKILERRIADKGIAETLDTYYVYDDLGRIRAVLMPQAVSLSNSTPYSEEPFNYSTNLKNHAWLYVYDDDGRLAEKRQPGAGATQYRYDIFGRMVFSQDPEERIDGKCRFYLYDNAGRNVVTGLCDDSYMPEAGVAAPRMTAVFDSSKPGLDGTGYTVQNIGSDFSGEVYVANYYDSPGFASISGFASLPGATTATGRRGLLMAVAERVFHKSRASLISDGVPDFAYTYYAYDYDDRLIKAVSSTTRADEYLTVTTTYDSAGHPLTVTNTLTHPDGSSHGESSAYSYDSLGRFTGLLSTLRLPNGGASGRSLVTTYDQFGRIETTDGAGGPVKYTYDVAGRVTGMSNKIFSETLGYSDGNRLISRITDPSDSFSRSRTYTYDDAGRLLLVSNPYNKLPMSRPGELEAAYTYDRNSNLTSISRNTYKIDAAPGEMPVNPEIISEEIDNLTLTYSGNRLVKATDDAVASVSSSRYDFNDGADESVEYTYDELGRLTSDLNRGITDIAWNPASRPLGLGFDNGDWMEYAYTANGTLLAERQMHTYISGLSGGLSASPLATDRQAAGAISTARPMIRVKVLDSRRFVGPFELVGDSVARVNIDGGFWENGWLHGYVTDWQGNVRGVLRHSNGTPVEQVTEYYPYGAPSYSENPTLNPYKYGGKRFDTRNGMDMAHHGARMLLNDLGRFASPDPLAELTPGISPYLYCGADPINHTDPTGLYSSESAAARDARARFPGQDIHVKYDDESGEYYLELNMWGTDAYDGVGDPVKDFGAIKLFSEPLKTANTLATGFGAGRGITNALLDAADYTGKYLKISRGLGKLATGVNLAYTTSEFYKYKMNGGENIMVYVKYGTDALVTVAPYIIGSIVGTATAPFWVSVATIGGVVYFFVDYKTNGFGLDYSTPSNKK